MPHPFPMLPYHNNLDAVTFAQTSAEQLALCVQTYRFARMVLDKRLESGLFTCPCVVMDLDETVFDNSEYNVWLISTGRNYHEPTTWRAWCRAGRALAVPGAVGFIHYVQDVLRLPLFFITSRRDADCREGTLQNLRRIGVSITNEEADGANLDENRLFMRGMGERVYPLGDGIEVSLNTKFQQRVFLETSRGFDIVLSIGDNLGDYADYYGAHLPKNGGVVHSTWELRRFHAEQDRAAWGTDFILIPNMVYGGWLRSLYDSGVGDASEHMYTSEPVRGEMAPSQKTRMDQLRGDFPEWTDDHPA